jgi:hypothetical protein
MAKRVAKNSGRSTASSARSSSNGRGKSTSSGSSRQTGARASSTRGGRQATGRKSSAAASRKTSSAQAESRERQQRVRQVQRASGRAGGGAAHPLMDHEEIQQWAEDRGAVPTCVRGTGGRARRDTGMIRLEFPRFGEEPKLQPISWDDWFQKFDDSGLAVMVQDETASGERSNFNKLVKRETALANAKPRVRAAR